MTPIILFSFISHGTSMLFMTEDYRTLPLVSSVVLLHSPYYFCPPLSWSDPFALSSHWPHPISPPKTNYLAIDLLLRELGEYEMIQFRIKYEASPPILSKETHCTCKEPARSTHKRMVPRHALCLDTPRQHVRRMAPRHPPRHANPWSTSETCSKARQDSMSDVWRQDMLLASPQQYIVAESLWSRSGIMSWPSPIPSSH